MNLSRLFRSTFSLVVLFSVQGSLIAQNQAPQTETSQATEPFKFSVKANLVLVPVIVTDKHGTHITGLKPDDFEVKEDGKQQKIVRLDELSSDSAKVEKPAVAPNTFTNELIAEHPKKLEIIALDHINTPFAATADANKGLINFLGKNIDSNTLVALVTLEHNGVRIVHNFTSDPSTLAEAVRKAQARLNSRDTRMQDISGESSESDAEILQIEALLGGVDISNATSAAQLAAAARASINQGYARVDASRQSQDALITVECLQQLAQYFSGVPGRKSLIWASTAFPFSLGSSPGSLTRGTTGDDWTRTFRMLQDANVAVYPVDVAGLVQGGSANTLQTLDSTLIKAQGPEGGIAGRSAGMEAVANGSLIDPNAARQQTMRSLADTTGGQAFYNSNDLAELFRKAGEDAAEYYVLSYYTANTGKPGWRKLSVKLRKSGDKVRTRSGFFFTPSGANQDATRRADELMALNSDLSFGSIPIKGQWEGMQPVGADRKVRFGLLIPAGVPFIDADHDRYISLDFRAVATNSEGQTLGNIGQRMEAHLKPEEASTIHTKGLDYSNEFMLPPGQYKVHFVVRDNLRDALGSIVVPLTVK